MSEGRSVSCAILLKIGGEFRLLRNNYYQSNQPAGLYQFDAGMTAPNPENKPGQAYVATPTACGAVCGGGQGFASFLLGYGQDGNSSVVTPSRMATQIKYSAVYVGDTFQATRKLTLNL